MDSKAKRVAEWSRQRLQRELSIAEGCISRVRNSAEDIGLCEDIDEMLLRLTAMKDTVEQIDFDDGGNRTDPAARVTASTRLTKLFSAFGSAGST